MEQPEQIKAGGQIKTVSDLIHKIQTEHEEFKAGTRSMAEHRVGQRDWTNTLRALELQLQFLRINRTERRLAHEFDQLVASAIGS